jgi:molecular chaperone GrpE
MPFDPRNTLGREADAGTEATPNASAPDPASPPADLPADAPEARAPADGALAHRSPADGATTQEHDAQPTEDPDAEDHEANVKRDLDELTAKASKADEYLALAQRTQADFENYRKRAIRESAAAQDRGVAKLAKELLPAVDNLDRALEAAEAAGGEAGESAENGAGPLVSGIKLVHADVIAALARVGIEPFSPNGEEFDPQHHEAIAQQPVEGAQPGTVVEVYQRGYRLGDNVLRPARVVVAS